MQLDVPLIDQPKKSWVCGPACVAMLMQYHGKDATIDSLDIKMYEGEWKGTFMPQLALPFLKEGMKATIVTMDPRYFQLKDKELSQEQIKARLEKAKEAQGATGELAKLMVQFMDAGGEFLLEIPSEKHLRQEINSKRPALALLTSRFMTADTPGYNQHFNVVTGIDEEFVYVNDPAMNDEGYCGGKNKYPKDAFFYGVHACAVENLDNGCFLLVKHAE